MKQPLKENGGLPASILWTLAIVAGVSVANIYYIQPLLNMIRHELGISEFRTNLIAMVTQIGYAAGLLFITPLGDLYQRKKIILVNFTVLIFSLLTIALTHNSFDTYRFIPHGSLFDDSTNIHSDSRPVLPSGK